MLRLLQRHNFIWLLLILLLIPGIITLIKFIDPLSGVKKWMSSDNLTGVTQITKRPPFDLVHIKSHDVQKYLEEKMIGKMPLRTFLIRMNNQIYYSIFKTSTANNHQLVIGNVNHLFEKSYILDYCKPNLNSNPLFTMRKHDSAQLEDWADKLKILSDIFEKRGQIFIYLITPSKAEYIPEAIPKRYHCQNVEMYPHITQIVKLLNERHVRYINGSDLMKRSSIEYKISMFPQGGTHWNMLGATIAANALISSINREGLKLKPIHFDFELNNIPKDSDKDLTDLLNLLQSEFPYSVPKINFKDEQSIENNVTIAFIGGSFLRQIIAILERHKTFSKLHYYYYFKLAKNGFEKEINEENLTSPQFLGPLLVANVIILEENSGLTISNHGQLFYDTLAQLPCLKMGDRRVKAGENFSLYEIITSS